MDEVVAEAAEEGVVTSTVTTTTKLVVLASPIQVETSPKTERTLSRPRAAMAAAVGLIKWSKLAMPRLRPREPPRHWRRSQTKMAIRSDH